MDLRKSLAAHLPDAVVGSVAIALYHLYTGDFSSPSYLLTEFPLYVLTLFVAFVVFDAIWYALFSERGE